jgi:hypothetical protein
VQSVKTEIQAVQQQTANLEINLSQQMQEQITTLEIKIDTKIEELEERIKNQNTTLKQELTSQIIMKFEEQNLKINTIE